RIPSPFLHSFLSVSRGIEAAVRFLVLIYFIKRRAFFRLNDFLGDFKFGGIALGFLLTPTFFNQNRPRFFLHQVKFTRKNLKKIYSTFFQKYKNLSYIYLYMYDYFSFILQ